MCRLAAYVGPEIPVASLIYDAPHGLEVQAYRPREMVSGHVNVDGTGVAWWRPGEAEPLRHVSDRPPWSDANLPSLGRRLAGAPQLAVVRSVTAGIPAGVEGAHPFVAEGLAGTHNGYLRDFRKATAWPLLERLPADLRARVDVLSDSLVLFLTAVAAWREGMELAAAAAAAVATAADVCRRAGVAASLNLVVAGPRQVVGVRHAVGVPANTLYRAEGAARWPGGRLLASEPLDDDEAWRAVPDGHVVTLDADGIVVVALGDAPAAAPPRADAAS